MRHPADARGAIVVHIALGVAPEFDLHRPLRTRHFPWVSIAQPLVGLLDLPAVHDLLLENTELVADAVAERRDLQRGHRIQKAGGQTPEAAIPQARLVLTGQQSIEIQPQLRHRLAHQIVHAEVDQVVAQVRSHQELGGEIGHGARAKRRVGRGRAYPAVQHPVAHGVREGHVVIVLRGERGSLSLHAKEIIEERILEGVLAQ